MLKNLEIIKAAEQFRLENGYNSEQPIRFKSLLQKLKVITIFNDFEEKISGISLVADNYRFMLINSALSIGRQHFSIAHELYHLFIQKDFENSTCMGIDKGNSTGSEEKKANVFASSLILPEQGLISLIPNYELKKDKISIDTILQIEQYYATSHLAVLLRLKDLGLISEKYLEKLKPDVKISAIQRGLDISIYNPGNKRLIIGDYGLIAKKLYDLEKISKGNYSEIMQSLGVDIDNIENTGDLDNGI